MRYSARTQKRPGRNSWPFSFAWEQRKLGDFTNVLSASRVHKNEWATEGVPFYRSCDVVSAFKGNDNEKAFISVSLYEELIKLSGKLEQDDILITGGGSIGIPYIVPNNKPLYSKDADLIWIKKSNKHNSKYLYTYFTCRRFRDYINSISHVGTIAHYTIEQVKNSAVLLPKIEEQNLISVFFSQIDHLITLHQSKCFSVNKNHDQVISQFTTAWEQRKLGEIATFLNGRAFSQSELLNEGKYKVLRVGNFYTNDSWYYSNLELPDKYYANNGDLLYTWSATFGPHIWLNDKVIYHYHIWKIELSVYLTKIFAFQLLEQDNASFQFDKNGSTMVHITKDNMENKTVVIPSNLNEQESIGQFLNKLNHLITLHQRKSDNFSKSNSLMSKKSFLKNEPFDFDLPNTKLAYTWEQRELNNTVTFYNGQTYSPSDVIGTSGTLVLRSCNVLNGEIVLSDNVFINNNVVNSNNVLVGDIIVVVRNGSKALIGKHAQIKQAMNNTVIGAFMTGIRSQMPAFMNALLNTHLFTTEVEKNMGATINQITGWMFKKMSFNFPNNDEQQKIGKLFEVLDHLITLHQREYLFLEVLLC